jgi:hypothetical protein
MISNTDSLSNTEDKVTQPIAPAADVNPFIDLFSQINPTYEVLFNRPPQRAAASRLLVLHPLDWWKRFMAAYSTKFEDRYCPKATTPIQLEEKLGAIQAYAATLKAKNSTVAF